jgi:ElaB/YqjD/DUF883 family membrane-anchored ribosome-binding protein
MNENEDFQFPTSQSKRHGNGADQQAARLGESVRGSLSQARQKLGDSVTQAQERSRQMVDSTTGYIQRWPFSTLAAAAGIGLLIGWMLATQSRHEDDESIERRWWR